MSPRTRIILITVAAVLLAVTAGSDIAHGDVLWPALAGTVLLLVLAAWLLPMDPDAAAAGLTLAGYIAANRGFAQVHPPGLPLLPAEAVLMLGLAWACIRRISRKTQLPLLPRVGPERAVALWMALCTLRVGLDVRTFGFMAVRDYAVAYYALFLFLGEDWGRTESGRRWLDRCLLVSLALAPVLYEITVWAPGLLEDHLQLNGIPLILIKSDSALPIMAGGAAWCACRAAARRDRMCGVLALLLFLTVAGNNNRAGLMGLVVAGLWLAVARAWGIFKVAAVACGAALAVLALTAGFGGKPWTDTKIYELYERAASITDFSNTRTYRSEELQDKGDNNTFRMVWWDTVIRRTWEDGRWFGLGFGYDLADEFSRDYFPSTDEEVTARSPHNVLVTLFARTGVIGFCAFLWALGSLAAGTWRTTRDGTSERLGLELFAWAILASACFGVVLEGPMGAVVFWTVLGLAYARARPDGLPASSPAGQTGGGAAALKSGPSPG